MMNYTSKFAPGQSVKIIGTDITARVLSVAFGLGWQTYKVSWWHHGDQKAGDMHEEELEKIN